MRLNKLWCTWIVGILLLSVVGAVAAQESLGTLTAGQPVVAAIEGPETPIRLDYALEQDSAVVIQVLAESARPTVTILRDGVPVVRQPNDESASIVTVTAFLTAGSYSIEIGTRDAAGTVFAVVQSETPIEPGVLPVGAAVSSEVTPQLPLALYTFSALAEPAYLYIESGLPESGVHVRVLDETTGRASATLDAALLGARLRIPAGDISYRLEVVHTASDSAEPFSLCLVAVSVGGCEGASAPSPTAAGDACVVTPVLAGGANIRQSASQSSPILAVLPGGATATVIGISPDGAWHNVTYNSLTGWVALSAATASGDCAGVSVVSPPPLAAATPLPTVMPTDAPPQQPSPTPSGPCIIRIVSPAYIYTQPTAEISYLQDQVQPPGELIVTGRYQAGGQDWWKTSYANAWYLNAPGAGGVFEGDCSAIPFVNP